MEVRNAHVSFDLDNNAGDPQNTASIGIGYWDAESGQTGGCTHCTWANNDVTNAPANAYRYSANGSNIVFVNNRAFNPGASPNPALPSSFRAGFFISAPAAIGGTLNISNNVVSDNLSPSRMGYGVEMATVNTSGIWIDGINVTCADPACASMVKAVAPNTITQLPYVRAILNVPATNVLPAVATAPNSTYESMQEGIIYTWNGTAYDFVIPHPGTPTISSGCGTGATINPGSTDRLGRLTLGTGTVTSCVLNWSKAFTTSNPIVFEQLGSAVGSPTLGPATSNTTIFSINGTNLASNIVIWSVPGSQN
jgi:hypothetical protein